MTDTIKKLKFKDSATILNAPELLEKEFIQHGYKTSLEKNIKSTHTLVFVLNEKELLHFLNKQLTHIEPDSLFWIAYPKGTSKIQTDINRDTIRVRAEGYNITTVSAISIDSTWSALRFRPTDRVGK